MKAKLDKMLLAALLSCALAMPMGLAGGEEAAPDVQLPAAEASVPAVETPDPTAAAPDVTEAVPSAEPTIAPSAVPTAEPTLEPSPEPTTEPSVAPSVEPSAGPSAEPTAAPSAEPTLEPEATESPKPDIMALPGQIDDLLQIAPENGVQQQDGSWRIEASGQEASLVFVWTAPEEAQKYMFCVQVDEESMRLIGETSETRMELPASSYRTGRYVVYVGAYLEDGSVTWGSMAFELASRPGGFPGGARPGGSGFSGQIPGEEQGFRVTPGEPLTSKHASEGTDTTAYTHSQIILSGEARSSLVLSSTQEEILLDNGAAFYVSREDGQLLLTPASEGENWQLSVLAMNTLAESGIERVVFQLDGVSHSLPAQMKLSGSVYASLRSRGYVSKDMQLCIDAQGVRVHTADGVYRINENGELVPCEE